MNKREFRRYLQQNPGLSRWLATNEEWLRNNPQAVESMLNNPSFISSYGQAIKQRRSQIIRRSQLLEARQAPSTVNGNKTRSRFKLPSLSELNQKINHTSQFIDGIQTMMRIIRQK